MFRVSFDDTSTGVYTNTWEWGDISGIDDACTITDSEFVSENQSLNVTLLPGLYDENGNRHACVFR